MSKQQELRDKLTQESKVLLIEKGQSISTIKDYWREQKANMYDIMHLTKSLKSLLLPYQEEITPLLFEGLKNEDIIAKLKESQPHFSDELINEIIEDSQNVIVEDAQNRLKQLLSTKMETVESAAEKVASNCYSKERALKDGLFFVQNAVKEEEAKGKEMGLSIIAIGFLLIIVGIVLTVTSYATSKNSYILFYGAIVSGIVLLFRGLSMQGFKS
ncbi:MAG: hypothetical protein EAZ55_00795 [Cytophagales bacterium]|nr:MAG: hypothetical protein EAZ55_00795 [Cytophagales bacterium]